MVKTRRARETSLREPTLPRLFYWVCRVFTICVGIFLVSLKPQLDLDEVLAAHARELESGPVVSGGAARPPVSAAVSVAGIERSTTTNHHPTFGLSVVHCKETREQMSWLEEIPNDWQVTVYETCRQKASDQYSVPFQNAGSEECTGYLQTIVDHYDNLPDISIFLQADGLIGRSNRDKPLHEEHTPFTTIQELIHATLEEQAPHSSTSWQGSRFLHYGGGIMRKENINGKETYTEYHPREVFDIMGLPYFKEDDNVPPVNPRATMTRGRSAACFAVSRERLRWKPKEAYQKLQRSILSLDHLEARKRCCALENTWHVVLGEPNVIPASSTMDDYWKQKLDPMAGLTLQERAAALEAAKKATTPK